MQTEEPKDAQELEVAWDALPLTIENLLTGLSHQCRITPEAVPILFVPGIMGTRLRQTTEQDQAWDPDDLMFMLWKYAMFFRSTGSRKQRMVGDDHANDYLEPMRSGEDCEKHQKEYAGFEHAEGRGWYALAIDFYASVLKRLYTWNREVGVPGYDMPVYALGYNWTNSNWDSGQALSIEIDRVIQEQQGLGLKCRQVILISHSMGGLVSRSASKLHGAEGKIRAILHGVQPATGAAGAYWQMKAGSVRSGLSHPIEWLTSVAKSWVIGSTGSEITALLGNIPGGLELLPNQLYRTNAGAPEWLKVVDTEGSLLKALPAGGDPYAEIYLERTAYWKLIEPAWLIPEISDPDPGDVESAWSKFSTRIGKVKVFHSELADYYHPKSQGFYGTGKMPGKPSPEQLTRPTPDEACFEVNVLDWKERAALALTQGLVKEASPDGEEPGGFRELYQLPDGTKFLVTLQAPSASGDGTVPDASATSLGLPLGYSAFLDMEHSKAYTVREDVREDEAAPASGAPPETFDTVEALLASFLAEQTPE